MSVDRTVPVYPIGVVQTLTGLSGRQIRYYEKMGLISPYRTPGNQRLYSPADTDRLLEIKRLLAQGLNIEGVKAHLASNEGVAGTKRDGSRSELEAPSEIDHDYIITQMRAGVKLSSLFPVNNQAALVRTVQRRNQEH